MYKFNIKKKIQRSSYILRSRKVSLALKNILLKDRIGIVDIGAGHRYLPILLNFDGIAKIAMVDPNKSLNWSFDNFKKLIRFSNNLFKFKFGISNKTSKIKYYIANTLTGSTFVDVFKIAKKNSKKLDSDYFGKKNFIIQQVYSFKDFRNLFFKYDIDIIKIDVEGLEDKIISSVMKHSSPFLIEVETNLNSEIYPNSFDKINLLLKKNNYKLLTGFPIYARSIKSSKNNSFTIGSYDNPVLRAPLEQFECIYIKEKKNYDLKEISILLGYGFLHEVKKIIKLSKIKLSKKKLNLIDDFIKKFF
tara:strand:+ start:916 stop:1827 length:912 start_codon:yes stop_codon:yes gene_type:complete